MLLSGKRRCCCNRATSKLSSLFVTSVHRGACLTHARVYFSGRRSVINRDTPPIRTRTVHDVKPCDDDVTTKSENGWRRVNTLSHYNVPDNATFLIDTRRSPSDCGSDETLVTRTLSGEFHQTVAPPLELLSVTAATVRCESMHIDVNLIADLNAPFLHKFILFSLRYLY